MKSGILYIVATPIGNLNDLSKRAIDTLSNVDLIACEDTRVTQKLLNHFGIDTKTISYHKFSEKERSSKLTELLSEGKNIALVSDAGTPVISDPGSILIKEAQEKNIKVIPIPGACAIITTLSAIFNDGIFAFCGFISSKINEIELYRNYIYDFNLVFYESPNRILKTLDNCKNIFGDIQVSIARELTKIHEDINTFSISDMMKYLEKSPIKGEIVLVLHKINKEKPDFDYDKYIRKLANKGYSSKDIAQILSIIFDISKNDIYKNILSK